MASWGEGFIIGAALGGLGVHLYRESMRKEQRRQEGAPGPRAVEDKQRKRGKSPKVLRMELRGAGKGSVGREPAGHRARLMRQRGHNAPDTE